MKKGFTLVELLAVIAILAILVIIALPNVMGMFNQAKKNAFTTEIKEIYKVAQQTWMSDSMFETSDKTYSRCKSGCFNELDLSGREELEYYIRIDKSGKVVEFHATDDTYQYNYENSNGLKIEDIKDVEAIADLSDSDIIHISPDEIAEPSSYDLNSIALDGHTLNITPLSYTCGNNVSSYDDRFFATSQNSAFIEIGYLDSTNKRVYVGAFVSIETDAETGDSRVIVADYDYSHDKVPTVKINGVQYNAATHHDIVFNYIRTYYESFDIQTLKCIINKWGLSYLDN